MQTVKKTLGSVATYINGRAFKPSEWKHQGLPIIRIQNLNSTKEKYNYSDEQHEDRYLIKNGDLLFAWSASLGAHIWKGSDAWLNQHIFKVIPHDDINKMYLYYFLLNVAADLYAKTHGSGMVHITKGPFLSTAIPVPPLAEQERIVEKIEELFSQLDAAVDELKKAKEKLNVYRQAVLKEAFQGDLTKEWRANHPSDSADHIWETICEWNKGLGRKKQYSLQEKITLPSLPSEWKWVFIGDISSGPEYGTSQKSSKIGKVPVIRMGNMQNGRIVWDDLVFSNDEQEIKNYCLYAGDVLFNRTNSPELVGKTSIYRGERDAIFAGYLIRINQYKCISPEYLTFYMNSFIAKKYGQAVKTDAVNQSNINATKLCSYPFPLCSIEEQKQIVYELECRLSLHDQIEQCVCAVPQKLDSLTRCKTALY